MKKPRLFDLLLKTLKSTPLLDFKKDLPLDFLVLAEEFEIEIDEDLTEKLEEALYRHHSSYESNEKALIWFCQHGKNDKMTALFGEDISLEELSDTNLERMNLMEGGLIEENQLKEMLKN